MTIISDAYNGNNVVFEANYLTGGIAERSPYKAAATVAAGAEWTRTRQGHAVRFAGNGLISYADNATNRLVGSDATFVVFGNFGRHEKDVRLISKRNLTDVSYEIYTHSSSDNVLCIYTGGTQRTFAAGLGGRKLVVISLVSGQVPACYLDGVFAANANLAPNVIPVGAAPLLIGNYWSGGVACKQPIQRVIILNRALSAAEIAQLYPELMAERYSTRAYHFGVRASVPKDPPGAPALLKTDFTRRTAPDPVTGERKLVDLSGNGWHGTIKPGFYAGPGMFGNSLISGNKTIAYIDFGDVAPINGAQKLSVVWYGFRDGSNAIMLNKGTGANVRNDIDINATAQYWLINSVNTNAADTDTNAPTFVAWRFDGSQVDSNNRLWLRVGTTVKTLSSSSPPPTALPNTAGQALEMGRIPWAPAVGAPDKNELLAIYPYALTPEQFQFIYAQIASRCTFSLDLQRVPVSLANLAGPCELPSTPLRLIGSWKVIEDAGGKHWLQSVTGGNMYPAYMRCTQAYGTYVFEVTHTAAIEWIVFIANTQAINYAQRNMYGLYLNGADVQLNKLTPTGGLTTLFTAANSITIGTQYAFAVMRSNDGQFTVLIRGGSYKSWTKLVVTSGTNPVTDNAYKTSECFYFTTTDATQGARFGNTNFFAGVLTKDQLQELCPPELPAINALEPFAFTTAKQVPSFVTAFSSSDAHTFVWGDGTSDVITSTGETKTHDYGGAGSRVVAFRVTDPLKLTQFHCYANNLSGTVPNLARFPNLQRFYCYTNTLTGQLPSLSQNPELTHFNCEGNQISGPVPSLSNNTKLVDFRCHSGNGFTGPIPSLTANTELQYLYMGGSALTGTISSLTNNTKLVHFYCSDAQISGYTPSTLAATITVFNVATNQLPQAAIDQILADFATNIAARPASVTISLNGSGNAKPSVAGFNSRTAIRNAKPGWSVYTNLQILSFLTTKQNPSITTVFSPADAHSYIWGDGVTDTLTTAGEGRTHDYGSPGSRIIELSVTTPTRLFQFHCYSNNLTGNVPALGTFTNLQIFYAYNNALTGTIPSLAANTALQSYNVDRNQLSGTIPSLTGLNSLIAFTCYSNQITGYTASTLSTTLTTFDAHDNLLTQAAVDQILADFATNVAARPASGTITLNGTGNAAPSAAGLASRAAILAAKPGWTILVNS